jgi:hypothetical protein
MNEVMADIAGQPLKITGMSTFLKALANGGRRWLS